MKIRVDEKIHIEQPTPAIAKWCRDNLVLDNPDYYKKERMGKWTGGTPREIFLYEKVGDELRLPFGCLQDIWRLCVRGVSWNVEISPIRHVSYESSINLYPYQEKAVKEALRLKNGVLVMPPGAGKTQTGLELIARIGGKALWLTHTQDLLNQSKGRAESVLTMPAGAVGTITAGKVNIGTHITFATVQTMAKLDLSSYRSTFDAVIVDESHHAISAPTRITQFGKVIGSLSARFKIGLTATPKRADGLERSMFALLGPKLHEVTRAEVADTTCPIKVSVIPTGWYPDCECVLMGDGTINYSKVIDNMIHDEDRYKVVFQEIARLNEPTIVLANRVEYLQRLCESARLFGKRVRCLSGMGQSKAAKEERKQALEALNNGELDCIFCTYSLAAEGLDVPNLRYVVFATPEKDPTRIQQASGRVGRKAPGKDCGIVIDFVDAFGMYKSWQKKREAVYKKLKYDII
ncbi:MAG TPA: DEAD/DEAH box helicase [Bacteroidales bacterium]|nr:DEAD/DEAH box helicase [Bacteroidales bacterium]